MSDKPETNTYISHKLAALFGYIALLAILCFAVWKGGNIWIERVVNSENMQVSEAITKTINEKAKLDLFMPEMVFINIDSSQKKGLTDSIKKQIAVALAKRYTSNEKVNPGTLAFQPFFIFPDSADKQGNYKLTKAQLEELKNHIVFLASQVDKAVSETKSEVNKEIDRINTWVSIWIGVLSIFGTIIPLFYNYKNNEDLKQIKDDAGKAKDKANQAHELIDSHHENLGKLKTIGEELGKLTQSYDTLKENITTATTNSTTALTNATNAQTAANRAERLVTVLNSLSKIKDIDAIHLLYNHQPIRTLKEYLIEIHQNLNNGADLFNEPMMRDIFRQLSVRLYLLNTNGIPGAANFDLLNNFVLDLHPLITQVFTQQSFTQALQLLNTLNNNLITEQ